MTLQVPIHTFPSPLGAKDYKYCYQLFVDVLYWYTLLSEQGGLNHFKKLNRVENGLSFELVCYFNFSVGLHLVTNL